MTVHLRTAVWLGILAPALLACPQGTDSAVDRVDALADSLAALSDAVGAQVDLTPGDSAYSVLRIDVGSIALTLDAIAPAGAGSRVTVSIGNLTSAVIDGLEATVSWGTGTADGSDAVIQGQSRRVSIAKPFPSGAWTQTSFVLDGVPPAQIGFLRIAEASATGIRLR